VLADSSVHAPLQTRLLVERGLQALMGGQSAAVWLEAARANARQREIQAGHLSFEGIELQRLVNAQAAWERGEVPDLP
jgi:hypothetical protein